MRTRRLPLDGRVYWVLDFVYWRLSLRCAGYRLYQALLAPKNISTGSLRVTAQTQTSFSNMHLFSVRSGFRHG